MLWVSSQGGQGIQYYTYLPCALHLLLSNLLTSLGCKKICSTVLAIPLYPLSDQKDADRAFKDSHCGQQSFPFPCRRRRRPPTLRQKAEGYKPQIQRICYLGGFGSRTLLVRLVSTDAIQAITIAHSMGYIYCTLRTHSRESMEADKDSRCNEWGNGTTRTRLEWYRARHLWKSTYSMRYCARYKFALR